MPEADLAGAVRRLRESQGLSVRVLAARTGVSASFLSQVENGLASPSIATMERIAAGLGVTLAQFFQDAGSAPPVVRADARMLLTSEWSKARIERVGGNGVVGRLDAVLVTIEPGGMSGKQPYPAPREEFAMVVKGRVMLTLGQGEHVMEGGDAVTIPGGVDRRWHNPYAAPACVLMASAG
ncbi:MAG: helix-turn-helix transcriptional regulator [Gemmatimonadales bacterium]|nr:helix-turn-helix transcriptional regulator [Gemmatimonadales bacterium]